MAQAVMKETSVKLDYPGRHHDRAAACGADGRWDSAKCRILLARNDGLTQTTFGISRDDAASFLGIYVARGILPGDPFVSIDREGVGALVQIGVERGHQAART